MVHTRGCKQEYYNTVKETPESVCHHKCVCSECGVELDPITLQPKNDCAEGKE